MDPEKLLLMACSDTDQRSTVLIMINNGGRCPRAFHIFNHPWCLQKQIHPSIPDYQHQRVKTNYQLNMYSNQSNFKPTGVMLAVVGLGF
jgi:hypothetical protein